MIEEYSKMKDHSRGEYKITDIDTLRTFISDNGNSVKYTAIIHIKEERFCAFKVFPTEALFICFYHPQTKNSLNLKTIQRLTKFLKDFQRSNDCSVLVFIGSNDSFSSGFDLNEFDEIEHSKYNGKFKAKKISKAGTKLIKTIQDFPALSFAVCNGYTYGAGLEIALACNYRLALANEEITKHIMFGFPEVNECVVPGFGGVQLLQSVVGSRMAREMVLSGEPEGFISSMDMGLVDKVFYSLNDVIQFLFSESNQHYDSILKAKKLLNDAKNGKKSNHVKVFSSLKIWR